MNYYVYAYLDTRKQGEYIYQDLKFYYEPIYVGKGQKRRYKNHLSLRNIMENHFYHKLNSMINDGFEPEIVIIKNNMDEDSSLKYEIETISKIGRGDNGPLTNLTNGGEGSSGRICSDETKMKISRTKIGEKNGMFGKIPVTKGKTYDEFFGIEKSTEIKKKLSENANIPNKGKRMSKEFCDNISKSIYVWYENNKDVKERISETLKKRFENKENHPMFGKKHKESSKKKLSESLKEYYKENPPKKLSEEIKHKMSISSTGDKNPAFTIYEIKNLETNDILTISGSTELRNFISNFKKEKGLGKTNPPSFNLILNGKNEKYFILINRYFPNRK
jgi:hypothetical protein